VHCVLFEVMYATLQLFAELVYLSCDKMSFVATEPNASGSHMKHSALCFF